MIQLPSKQDEAELLSPPFSRLATRMGERRKPVQRSCWDRTRFKPLVPPLPEMTVPVITTSLIRDELD